MARSYGPRVVPAFLNLRAPYVNEDSNSWTQMTLSNGRALTGAPPAFQRGYQIVPADAVPPDATVEQSVGDGAHVSVAVPHPTVASINPVTGAFDGIVAHDVFDLGPAGMDEARAPPSSRSVQGRSGAFRSWKTRIRWRTVFGITR